MQQELNITIFGNRMPYKNNIIHFHQNEKFYTIVEIDKDISVFEDNEWKGFKKIMDEFNLRWSWLASDSDYSYSLTPKEYIQAVYYLSEIDFDNMEIKEYMDGNDVYDTIYKINDDVTINQTRNWIITNYHTIQKHYHFLLNDDVSIFKFS